MYDSTVCCLQQRVHNRRKSPDSFYGARQALDEIFVKNNMHDVYSNVSSERCPFSELLHRKAIDGMP